jgi:hypothetical protein
MDGFFGGYMRGYAHFAGDICVVMDGKRQGTGNRDQGLAKPRAGCGEFGLPARPKLK